MSATANVQADQVQQIVLNDEQVNAIIDYAVKAGLYDGTPPEDPGMKRTDAATLVYQARRARDQGNQDERVKQICFIADVDQKADNVPNPPAADPAAAFAPGNQPEQAPAQNGGGSDYSNFTPEQLQQMIDGLTPQQHIPSVRDEIGRIVAEQQRRQGAPVQTPAPVQAQAPPAAQAPPQPPAPPSQPTGAPVPPASGGPVLAEGARDASGQPRPLADATFQPAPAPSQPGAEGFVPQAAPTEEAGRRSALEAQITGQILQTYGKTFADVAAISTDDLERMIANPGAPAAPVPQVSSEREALEAQVTGPMLKAWRRGRVDVVGLSDDELREMVQHPAGPTTRPQGEGFLENNPAAAFAPGQPAVSVPTPTTSPPVQVQSAGVPIVPPSEQVQSAGTQRAMEIIAREKAPIPPDIVEPPNLPADISKSSDEELRSVHGRFHAVEARLNWVISQEEDKILDLERMKAIQEAHVRNTPREGKKPTKDEMQAIVDADPKVQEIEGMIHEARKATTKLKVVRDNAHLTCQRCSREWSMRFNEAEPGKRGTP